MPLEMTGEGVQESYVHDSMPIFDMGRVRADLRKDIDTGQSLDNKVQDWLHNNNAYVHVYLVEIGEPSNSEMSQLVIYARDTGNDIIVMESV